MKKELLLEKASKIRENHSLTELWKMKREIIERLAIDSAAGELNEDMEALFRFQEEVAQFQRADGHPQFMKVAGTEATCAFLADIGNKIAEVINIRHGAVQGVTGFPG